MSEQTETETRDMVSEALTRALDAYSDICDRLQEINAHMDELEEALEELDRLADRI